MDFPIKRIFTASSIGGWLATTALTGKWTSSVFAKYFGYAWLLSTFFYAVWAVILWPKVFSPLRGLPEPENPSWWNGQWKNIRGNPTGTPMLEWVNTIPNQGIIRYLGFFNQERLLIASPQALSEVLVTRNYDFEKPSFMRNGLLGRILGLGIILSEGEEHKGIRKALMPAFAFRHIKGLYPIFWEKACEGAQAMAQQVLVDAAKKPSAASTGEPEKTAAEMEDDRKTGVLNVAGWSSRLTLDIIGVAGMGYNFRAIEDPTNKLFNTYNTVFQPSRQARLLQFISLFIPGWIVTRLPIRHNGEMTAAVKTIRQTCRDLIRHKKEKLGRKEPADLDILSVALENGGFSEENLVDQLMSFLAAGHETTATSLTWAIYLMCCHPEMQTRLRQEIRERLPSIDDHSATITSLEIDRMPYLNAVCSEVIRYFAPVPMTLREAVVDTTILGHRVPKGTRITLTASATNKDVNLWGPDAAKFNPDRWLPKFEGDKSAGLGGATSNYAMLTFLHGPRSCMGLTFAKGEFACMLATWVGRMEFALEDPELMDEEKIEVKSGITSRPAHGMRVKVKVLDGW